MARDGFTAADADRRLAAQWPITDKVRLADAVVVTDGDMTATFTQAARLAAWLRGRCRPS
jgi:dephospho-CoA kinase